MTSHKSLYFHLKNSQIHQSHAFLEIELKVADLTSFMDGPEPKMKMESIYIRRHAILDYPHIVTHLITGRSYSCHKIIDLLPKTVTSFMDEPEIVQIEIINKEGAISLKI